MDKLNFPEVVIVEIKKMLSVRATTETQMWTTRYQLCAPHGYLILHT